MAHNKNCRVIVAGVPISVIMNDFAWRMKSKTTSPKLIMRMIRRLSREKTNKFIGAATNKSKRYTMAKPIIIKDTKMTENFLNELMKLTN
jgi:hypothetical protein